MEHPNVQGAFCIQNINFANKLSINIFSLLGPKVLHGVFIIKFVAGKFNCLMDIVQAFLRTPHKITTVSVTQRLGGWGRQRSLNIAMGRTTKVEEKVQVVNSSSSIFLSQNSK